MKQNIIILVGISGTLVSEKNCKLFMLKVYTNTVNMKSQESTDSHDH